MEGEVLIINIVLNVGRMFKDDERSVRLCNGTIVN